jgi:hypothetical protein
MLPNEDKALIAVLEQSGWRKIHGDKVGVIYVRPNPLSV